MSIINRTAYYSGTSGLLLPVPNKLHFPEEFREKSRLSFYASLMNSIEVNSSFYKVPMAATVQRWAADVPSDFRFTFKLWKGITHNKGLAFDPQAVDHFMHIISIAGDKKGSLLVQFPPAVKVTDMGQLKYLFACIRKADPDQHWETAVEFRHGSWYQNDTYELLNQYNAGMVIHDKAPAITPLTDLGRQFVYLRFHGPDGNYTGSYPDDFLYKYVKHIKAWMAEGKTVYCYFNNTIGDAIKNLMTLREFVYR